MNSEKLHEIIEELARISKNAGYNYSADLLNAAALAVMQEEALLADAVNCSDLILERAPNLH